MAFGETSKLLVGVRAAFRHLVRSRTPTPLLPYLFHFANPSCFQKPAWFHEPIGISRCWWLQRPWWKGEPDFRCKTWAQSVSLNSRRESHVKISYFLVYQRSWLRPGLRRLDSFSVLLLPSSRPRSLVPGRPKRSQLAKVWAPGSDSLCLSWFPFFLLPPVTFFSAWMLGSKCHCPQAAPRFSCWIKDAPNNTCLWPGMVRLECNLSQWQFSITVRYYATGPCFTGKHDFGHTLIHECICAFPPGSSSSQRRARVMLRARFSPRVETWPGWQTPGEAPCKTQASQPGLIPSWWMKSLVQARGFWEGYGVAERMVHPGPGGDCPLPNFRGVKGENHVRQRWVSLSLLSL